MQAHQRSTNKTISCEQDEGLKVIRTCSEQQGQRSSRALSDRVSRNTEANQHVKTINNTGRVALNGRKHFSMMDWQELNYVRKAINSRSYEFTAYSIERAITRGITTRDIMKSVIEGSIVEVHFKDGSPRVLLRGKKNKRGIDTCVVIDLYENAIVTVYQNDARDRHWSLDTSLYDETLDICALIRESLDGNNKNTYIA